MKIWDVLHTFKDLQGLVVFCVRMVAWSEFLPQEIRELVCGAESKLRPSQFDVASEVFTTY